MGDGRIAQVEVIVFKIVDGKPIFLLMKRQPERGGFWQPVTGGVEADEGVGCGEPGAARQNRGRAG